MPLCPRCASRKAKRFCPALEREICSLCCAEERLRTIACPQDCPHLGSELYQQRRRKERAHSQGKAFLEHFQRLFSTEATRELAFCLATDIYFFGRDTSQRPGSLPRAPVDPVQDAIVVRALRALPSALRGVIVPQEEAQGLFDFLLERLGDARRYGALPLDAEHRDRALLRLAEAIEKESAPSSARYWSLLASFFDELDVEADLDYSPDDGKEERSMSGDARLGRGAPHAPEPPHLGEGPDRRSRGGIILP